ncbi:MAG: tetratricopeptide repeat protein [Candidatus Omnitrophota bacterium]
MEESPKQSDLSSQELVEALNRIVSSSVNYDERVKLAAEVIDRLEKMGKPSFSEQARKICLEFYASIPPNIKSACQNDPVKPFDKNFHEYAQLIDRGKRNDALAKIHAYLENKENKNPHPSLAVMALKSDDMPSCYAVLFVDLAQRKVSPYSQYVIGYLTARIKRMREAEQLLTLAKDKLGDPILEDWITFDLAKIYIVNGETEKAGQIIDNQLKKSPNNAGMLYLKVLYFIANRNDDAARQQLARLEPFLYEDPYLLANTATTAVRINEVDTAVRILEKFEAMVEPNREFYSAFAMVRKVQGKIGDAEKYTEKANRIPDVRVAVAGMLPPSEELKKIIASVRDEKQSRYASLEGIDPLAKSYMNLLDYNAVSAINILEELVKDKPANYVWERFTLAAFQRRFGKIGDALETLKTIAKNHPEFRPYRMLALLADLSYRLGDEAQAKTYYAELDKQFPQSYQAFVAKRFLNSSYSKDKTDILYPIRLSPLMSQFANYSAPFVFSEIGNYWGDNVEFSTVCAQLGVNPRRGLQFNEFLAALLTWTRYRIVPFIGSSDAVLEFLKQKIPVVFCQGDMFAGNNMIGPCLIVGADPGRGLFYAENVTPSDPHLYASEELMEGICLAAYPDSLNPTYSKEAEQAIALGEEYARLNSNATKKRRDNKTDDKDFLKRRETIAQEKSPLAVPMQLAFARWIVQNEKADRAKKYFDSIQPLGKDSAQFLFLSADFDFRQKRLDPAAKALDAVVQKSPENPRYALALMRIMYLQGKIKEALRMTESMREQFPEDPAVSAHLMALYDKTGAKEKKAAEEKRLKDFLHIENIEINLDLPAK